jgi:hypothetical protein
MRVDGQTIIAAIRNFANAPKSVISGKNTVKPTKKTSGISVNTSIRAKTSHFEKHSFFEHNSLVSAVARAPPIIIANPNDKY